MKYFLVVYLFFFFQSAFTQNDKVINEGRKLIDENKLVQAENYFEQKLKNSVDNEQKAHLLFGLADTYKLQLNNIKASEYYLKAFRLIRTTKNIQLEFLYHVKMAEFFRKRSMFKDALNELDEAGKILKNNKINDVYAAKYFNRKAALFTEYAQNNDSTLFYANKSLKLAKAIKDKEIVFYSILEISGVYERKKDYKTSVKYLEEIIEFSKNNNIPQHQADAYVSYIMVLARDNQLNKALNASLYAADFSKKNNLLYNEVIFNQYIQNLYFRLHNVEKAYEYLLLTKSLSEKYNDKQNDKLLFDIEAKYKLKEKNHEIKIKNLEINNKNQDLVTNKIILYTIVIMFLLALTMALLLSYYFFQIKKRNLQLNALSQENKFLLSEANHRINNNLQLIIILIQEQLKKMPKDLKIEINNILTKIDAIATLHRHLHKGNDVTKIDLKKYLNEIYINFNTLFNENNIKTNFKIDELKISADSAMYFGLLLTELCINSIKHAFNNQNDKNIQFEMIVQNNKIVFKYMDNGNLKLNPDINPKLIDKLCRQLKLDYKIDVSNGFAFSFEQIIY